MRLLAAVVMVVTLSANEARAASCRIESGNRILPLVELFTSEGCDSCPTAERWLSAEFPPGKPAAAVAITFHVDYWDRLGWKDRFANRTFTERQYAVARARGNALVYTPQVLVQGRAIERWQGPQASGALHAARNLEARASLEASAVVQGDSVDVEIRSSLVKPVAEDDAALFVAYLESGLVSQVTAGENRGARLTHDHVVRDLQRATLKSNGITQATFSFRRPAESGVAPTIVAFVQNRATGDVLQSIELLLDSCR